MNQRSKVDAQPAYVLHSIPFRETSLIVEVFTRDFGRMALLARGARRPRATIRGLLMGFQPLEIGWAGKGEVLTLMKAEWQGGQPLLAGDELFCGYYLNEMLREPRVGLALPRERGTRRPRSLLQQQGLLGAGHRPLAPLLPPRRRAWYRWAKKSIAFTVETLP